MFRFFRTARAPNGDRSRLETTRFISKIAISLLFWTNTFVLTVLANTRTFYGRPRYDDPDRGKDVQRRREFMFYKYSTNKETTWFIVHGVCVTRAIGLCRAETLYIIV